MFEMLTGAVPFTRRFTRGRRHPTLNDEFPAPSSIDPSVPPMLDAVGAQRDREGLRGIVIRTVPR